MLQRGPGCLGRRRLPLPLAVTVLAQARCLQAALGRLARKGSRQGRPAISMPEDPSPGPVLGKSRRHAHGQGLQHASASKLRVQQVGWTESGVGAGATTAGPIV